MKTIKRNCYEFQHHVSLYKFQTRASGSDYATRYMFRNTLQSRDQNCLLLLVVNRIPAETVWSDFYFLSETLLQKKKSRFDIWLIELNARTENKAKLTPFASTFANLIKKSHVNTKNTKNRQDVKFYLRSWWGQHCC